jgi:S-adenosylmethionine-dependent methyltransferase
MADPFDEHVRAWQEYVETPWSRIRYAVVRHTLERSLAALGAAPLRVLDVGGGDGGDALPLAQAGHEVTILDPSREMLDLAAQRARAAGVTVRTVEGGLDDLGSLGRFDVVLCHFVLQYRPGDPADLAALVGAVRPGGLLSVIVVNPAGQVLGRLVREGPAEALAELERDTGFTVTFDQEVRKVTAEETQAELERLGCRVVGRYGGRIANDLIADNAAKSDPDFYADLERLELALCDREPFLQVGLFWQLVVACP